jgi:hypothetical protein
MTVPEELKSYGVTASGKVYWNKRNALGQFVSWDGSTGSAEYAAYLESRAEHIEADTRGNMITRAGRERGVTVSDLLRPRASLRYASEELKDWYAKYGRTLSYAKFRA